MGVLEVVLGHLPKSFHHQIGSQLNFLTYIFKMLHICNPIVGTFSDHPITI